METIQVSVQNFFFHCTYERNLDKKTIKAYTIDLKQFVEFNKSTNGKIDKMTQIDKEVIRGYLKNIFEKHKPRTIRRKIATLKAFFNYLEYEDKIISNPFRKMKLKIQEGKQLPRTIRIDIIKRLFEYIYSLKERSKDNCTKLYSVLVRDIAILELLFSTGIHVSELCNLKKADVDINGSRAKIQGKGRRERTVPFCTNETRSAIFVYNDAFTSESDNCEYFFANKNKKRISEQSVRYLIRKYVRLSELNCKITPHMFRHTIATLLLENGLDIRYIQSLLGHSTINTTQIYAQVNDEARRRLIE